MTLGKVFLEMLNFCTTAQVDAKLKEIANECILTISGVNQTFPKVVISNDMKVLKSIFRKANT